MQELIKGLSETFALTRSCGRYQLPKRDKRDAISVISSADDFVILHESLEAIQRCQSRISEWLIGISLELKLCLT
ncbi:hypothetical protein [Microseira wollei]|nr:hypothetical protein [Microseira wollei]